MPDQPHGAVAIASLSGRKLAPEGSRLVLTEWTIEGESETDPQWMAPLHLHHEDDEAWYVIEGSLRVRVGDDVHDVPAGGAVLGPRGVPHTFCNPAPDPLRTRSATSLSCPTGRAPCSRFCTAGSGLIPKRCASYTSSTAANSSNSPTRSQRRTIARHRR